MDVVMRNGSRDAIDVRGRQYSPLPAYAAVLAHNSITYIGNKHRAPPAIRPDLAVRFQMNVTIAADLTSLHRLPEENALRGPSLTEGNTGALSRRLGRRAPLLCFFAAALCACAPHHEFNYRDEGVNSATTEAANAYPTNYKSELLAFLRTYLNDPTHIRDAFISEPAIKPLGHANRYVVCLRFSARQAAGDYARRESVAVYIAGKFNQLAEAKGEGNPCAAADYQPFPELEHLQR